MLGLSNTLTTSSTLSESAGPIQLASYTSDFSTASKQNWFFSLPSAVTLTSNNDGVGGEDDVLKGVFDSGLTNTQSFRKNSLLASGGIVAGDTIDVSFKYRIERSGSGTSNIIFFVRPGGYAATRNYQVTTNTSSFDSWIDVTHTFDNPAATSNEHIELTFASGGNYPLTDDIIYFKDFVITHNGLAR